MNKPPAFQFYPDDFIGGTVDMSAQEVGAYVRLLCYQWGRESIPEDRKVCDRIAGCKVTDAVLAKFPGGKNPRLERTRQEQQEFREAKSEAGKNGAYKRWHSQDFANGKPMAQPSEKNGTAILLPLANTMAKNSSPPPSPSPIQQAHKASSKRNAPAFTQEQTEMTARYHQALGELWENDRQKWMGRIKNETEKAARVIAEVELAAKEARIKTDRARYAEQTWKEFQ